MESDLRKRGVRLALYALLVFAALAAIYYLRDITAPLLGGFLLAYLLDPVVSVLTQKSLGPVRIGRATAVVLIFAVVLVAAAAALTTAGIALAGWIEGVYHDMKGEESFTAPVDLPAGVTFDGEKKVWFQDSNGNGRFEPGYVPLARARIEEWGRRSSLVAATLGFLEREMAEGGVLDPDNLRARAIDVSKQLPAFFLGRARGDERGGWAGASDDGSTLFAIFSWLVLCPLYAFFFLLRFAAIGAYVRRYLPARGRPQIERVMLRIDSVLGKFLRGRMIACVVKGALTSLALWMCGIDYWFPIGMAAGFLSLIPYVGILAAVIPALLLSWFEYESFARLGAVLGVFIAMEAVEGFVLVPLLLGKEIGLHPLTVLVTLFIFGKIFGFVGVLLSVPLAAISKILAEEFLLPFLKKVADEKIEDVP